MHELQLKYKDEIESMVYVCNEIASKGFVASHGGNISLKVDDNVILITPTKVPKKYIQFDDIVIIDFEGKVLLSANNHKPTGETPFHLHILKKRPDLNALLHAHPPYITGLAIAHSDLLSRPLLPEPIIELGPVLTVPYEEPLSQELADAFDKVVLQSNAFLMQNHGVLLGSTEGIERALDFVEMLEAAAMSIQVAVSLGKIEEISVEGLKKLDKVIKVRNLPMPGLPGMHASLVDAYNFDVY